MWREKGRSVGQDGIYKAEGNPSHVGINYYPSRIGEFRTTRTYLTFYLHPTDSLEARGLTVVFFRWLSNSHLLSSYISSLTYQSTWDQVSSGYIIQTCTSFIKGEEQKESVLEDVTVFEPSTRP